MSDKEKWLEQAEKAEKILWDLYNNEIEGDSNLGMYSLNAAKGITNLCDYLKKEVENGTS